MDSLHAEQRRTLQDRHTVIMFTEICRTFTFIAILEIRNLNLQHAAQVSVMQHVPYRGVRRLQHAESNGCDAAGLACHVEPERIVLWNCPHEHVISTKPCSLTMGALCNGGATMLTASILLMAVWWPSLVTAGCLHPQVHLSAMRTWINLPLMRKD